jgi:hypothetical protein
MGQGEMVMSVQQERPQNTSTSNSINQGTTIRGLAVSTVRNLSLLILAAVVVAAASHPGRATEFVINELLPMARATIAGACLLAEKITRMGTRMLVEFSMLDRNFGRHIGVWGVTLALAAGVLIKRLIQLRHAIRAAIVLYASDLRKWVSRLRVVWTFLKIIFR